MLRLSSQIQEIPKLQPGIEPATFLTLVRRSLSLSLDIYIHIYIYMLSQQVNVYYPLTISGEWRYNYRCQIYQSYNIN